MQIVIDSPSLEPFSATHFGIAEDNYLSTDADEYEINNKLARERKFSEKSK